MVNDLTTKRCLSDNERYADLINDAVVGGRQLQKLPGITEEEFLSGFLKDSRLWPCITFGLYFGEKFDLSRECAEDYVRKH